MVLPALALLAVAPAPKNVILMIADGCGTNEYVAASMFEGRLGKEVFNGKGWVEVPMATYPLRVIEKPLGTGVQDPEVVYDPAKAWNRSDEYKWLKESPTDSGASATAYATGLKTYKHSICWSDLDQPMTNANDLFKKAGKAVGVVTSVEWSDATPAAMIAHNRNRDNRTEIAREMVEKSGADVILGACHPWYDGAGKRLDKMGGADWVGERDYFTTPIKVKDGVRFIETKAEFEAFAKGKLDMMGASRVVGTAQVSGGLQIYRPVRDWNGDGKVDGDDHKVAPIHGDPLNKTVPDLPTMTAGALRMLSKNPKGFFLMVEGGAVDTSNHFNWPARSIEEALAFFRTVESVDRWIQRNGGYEKNLLIVTADHECGLILGPNSDKVPFDPIVNRGKGTMPGLKWKNTGHANMLITAFAKGPGADLLPGMAKNQDPVRGRYIDNTDLHRIIRTSAVP